MSRPTTDQVVEAFGVDPEHVHVFDNHADVKVGDRMAVEHPLFGTHLATVTEVEFDENGVGTATFEDPIFGGTATLEQDHPHWTVVVREPANV